MAGNCTGANAGANVLGHRARTHASARRPASDPSDRRRNAAQGFAQQDAVRPQRAGGVTSGSLKSHFGLQIVLTGHAGGPFTSAAGWCDIGRGLDPGPSDQGAPGIAKGCAREQDQDHETPEPIEEIGTQEADEPGRVAQGRRLVRQGIAIGGNQGSAAVAESPASRRFIAGFRPVEPRVCGPFARCCGRAKGLGRSLCVPPGLDGDTGVVPRNRRSRRSLCRHAQTFQAARQGEARAAVARSSRTRRRADRSRRRHPRPRRRGKAGRKALARARIPPGNGYSSA